MPFFHLTNTELYNLFLFDNSDLCDLLNISHVTYH